MQQTNPDISSTRRRPPRPVLLILGLGALTGPLFLFAIAVDRSAVRRSKSRVDYADPSRVEQVPGECDPARPARIITS